MKKAYYLPIFVLQTAFFNNALAQTTQDTVPAKVQKGPVQNITFSGKVLDEKGHTPLTGAIYLTTSLTYLGLGHSALFVTGIKSLITTGAHSSIPWDKPFYTIKWLKPIGWVLERLISTPATHHAHHADTTDDGVGHYKGNFGNMFFLWDVIFKTGIITRQYPKSFGLKHYKEEEWYAQFMWPIFKSKKEGSELAANGPEVGDEVTVPNTESVLSS